MHGDSSGMTLLISVGIVLAAALVGGVVARAFRAPVVVGYLLAGVVIGPNTPGFIADVDSVTSIANIGVVLLMFAVGVQFSLKELGAVKRTALIGGGIQIVGTIFLGIAIGLSVGWSFYASLFLGCALSLSSTAVIVRVLEERGELGSSHGSIVLGISVVQDLSLILMATVLPSLGSGEAAGPIAAALFKAAAFIGVTIVLAIYFIPALMSRIVRSNSPELFVLTVVVLCFLAASAAEMMGLGLAIGAFLAGVVVSESPYSHEIFSQIRPLRDVFASLFFVSIGMLLDPQYLASNWALVTTVVIAILVGKAIISALGIYITGWHGRVAFLGGLALAQIGEFSFVLAALGSSRGVISEDVSRVILTSALVTLLVWPFLYEAARPAYAIILRMPTFARLFDRRLTRESSEVKHAIVEAKVIILGGGRVGRYVSDALRSKEIPHVVVDFDYVASKMLRERGVPILYGDASSDTVLKHLQPERAELAVVALPEVAITEMAVKKLRQLAPKLPIVARVRRGIDIPKMRQAGADAVVHGEFESGVEMIRQTLDRLGYEDGVVDSYIEDVRQYRYRNVE